MSNAKSSPQNISDAVKRLEAATSGSNGSQFSEDLDTIKRALADLKPHFQQLKEDAAQMASDAFREPLQQAKAKFQQGKETAKEFGGNVDKKVHESPWIAMGIAGLVAFLIGFLIGRKD